MSETLRIGVSPLAYMGGRIAWRRRLAQPSCRTARFETWTTGTFGEVIYLGQIEVRDLGAGTAIYDTIHVPNLDKTGDSQWLQVPSGNT